MKNNKYKLVIRAQNLEEEFDYLWWIINNLAFYRKNNYTVKLPDNNLFLDLIREKKLDREKLFKLFKKEIYKPQYFESGIKNIKRDKSIFDEASNIFEEMNNRCNFKLFEEYDVLLTAYGPGGSYTPYGNKAKIIMLTTVNGDFKIDPIETIIHEMVHLGIEENVVKKFKLEHWEKEALVDSICFLKFKKVIPNYRYQNFGNTKMRDYIDNETVNDIPKLMKKYINDYPR